MEVEYTNRSYLTIYETELNAMAKEGWRVVSHCFTGSRFSFVFVRVKPV